MDAQSLVLPDLRLNNDDKGATDLLARYLRAKRPPVAMTSDLPMIAVGG